MYMIIFYYILVIVFNIFLYYTLFTWVHNLIQQGCECSDLWQRKYVHNGALLIPILISLFLILVKTNSLTNNTYAMIIVTIFVTINITYYSILISYINDLKRLECKCSESWKRDFAFIYSIIVLIQYGLSILFGGFVISSIGYLLSKNKK